MRPDKEKELFRDAFDNLSYALEISNRENATPAELRRASNVLRCLLLPGKGDDLLRRAAARLHHDFTFPSKDYEIALQLILDGQLVFFQRGGAALWGLEYEGLAGGPATALDGIDLHSVRAIELTHDRFLSEIVIGFHGCLISRKTVLEWAFPSPKFPSASPPPAPDPLFYGGDHSPDRRTRCYISRAILLTLTDQGVADSPTHHDPPHVPRIHL